MERFNARHVLMLLLVYTLFSVTGIMHHVEKCTHEHHEVVDRRKTI